MKKALATTVVWTLFLGAAYAWNIEIGGGTGALIPLNDAGDLYDASFMLGVNAEAGVYSTDHFIMGVRLEALYASLNSGKEGHSASDKWDIVPLIGSIVVTHSVNEQLDVSILAGLGYYLNDWEMGVESGSADLMGYSGGLELDYGISSQFRLGVQARYHLVTGCEGESDTEYLSCLLTLSRAL